VQLLPEYAEAHYNLGVAYLQLDKKDKAREQQQILENLNPELAAKLEASIKRSLRLRSRNETHENKPGPMLINVRNPGAFIFDRLYDWVSPNATSTEATNA